MLIDERTYQDAIIVKTEGREKQALEILDNWSKFHDMLETPGWAVLQEIVEKEFSLHNSVYNAKSEELEFKRGYCTGLKFAVQIVKAYKRKAVEAQNHLDSIAKKEQQNA